MTPRHDAREPTTDAPQVPGFRTWRSLYLFVAIIFVATVVALAIFSRVYS